MGVGKTTVASLIASKEPRGSVFLEERDEYLLRYYHSPREYAFLNQLSFTLRFLQTALDAGQCEGEFVIQDRCIYEAHDVFTRLRRESGLISDAEYLLLERLVKVAETVTPKPSLLVFLDAPPEVAYRRVAMRGISYESGLSREAHVRLYRAYQEWFDAFRLCPKTVVPTDRSSSEEVATLVLERIHSLPIVQNP